MLFAQSVYLWGDIGVRTIVDKLHYKKDVPTIIPMELVRVIKGQSRNVGAAAQGVGLHRTCRPRTSSCKQCASHDELTRRFASRTSPSAFPACRRSTTSRSRSRAARATRSAARMARARARSERSSPASTRPTAGRLFVDGREVAFDGPRDALAAGVGHGASGARVLRQPLRRREPVPRARFRRARGFVERGELSRRASAMLAEIGVELDVLRPLGELTRRNNRSCRSRRPSAAARVSSCSTSRQAA